MYRLNDILDTIICGDTITELKKFPNESIDCVITSPPYWNLRDYDVVGQIGTEATQDEYITNLMEIFEEVKRALKDSGTCWVVLGDTYDKTKSLCGVPEQFALEMKRNKWVRRNTIIWKKPSCMPFSGKDRFTVDFEYVYFFTKKPRYWFEQQLEPYTTPLNRWGGEYNEFNIANSKHESAEHKYKMRGMAHDHLTRPNPAGRNKRTVWSCSTASYPEAHFAVFPEQLIEPMILAGCPPIVCPQCRTPYIQTYRESYLPKTEDYKGKAKKNYKKAKAQDPSETKRRVLEAMRKVVSKTGYEPVCICNAEQDAGIVLDPFIGSGTTGVVAKRLDRRWIGIDLNSEYCQMSRDRIDSS